MSEQPPTGKSTGFDYDAWDEELDSTALKEAMQVYYDQRASEYVDWFLRTGLYDRPETNEAFLAGLRQLEDELHSFGGGRILEIACGIGWWTSILARASQQTGVANRAAEGDTATLDLGNAPTTIDATGLPQSETGVGREEIEAQGRQVVALDYGPSMLAECRKRLTFNRAQAALLRASAYALPFAEDSFDSCFFGFFFSHVPHEDVAPFLSEVKRVVRPGGHVCIFDSSLPTLDHVETEIQQRPLRDGSLFPALKVYYGATGLAQVLEPFAEELSIKKVEGLFISANYRSPG
jgi:demethylmenaquinone methyltransferase/2-methoxy-6-polyprenyl-1,4-benzoquinol methylase